MTKNSNCMLEQKIKEIVNASDIVKNNYFLLFKVCFCLCRRFFKDFVLKE